MFWLNLGRLGNDWEQLLQDGETHRGGSINGGNASTDQFKNVIDCSTANSTLTENDTLYDCGGAAELVG